MADSVIIRIDGDEKEYELSLKNVEKQAEKTGKKVQSSMDSSAKVVAGLNKTVKGLALGVGAVGAAVIGMGVNYNAQIEQYTAGFTTMLGSAEKANDTLANLRSFAEKTPFELTDLANASTTLLAFGEDVDSLMPDLKMLGDISLGNSEKFKSLALVFGQVQSQGKLMGQDLLQMINSGFNPLQVISEKTGESMSSLKDKMSAGGISFEMVAEAMRTATSEGGQFYNAMETQSKTFQGQMSTLKDNVTSLTGDIASDISEKLTDDVLPMLIEKVEHLKQAWADGSLQSAIGTATSGMVAFGVAVGGLNIAMIANDMIQLKKGVEGYTAATKLGTAAQKLLNAELLKNPYTLAITAIVALTAGIITYAATHKSAAKEIAESHKEAIEAIDENIETDRTQAETAIVLKDKLFELEGQINSGKLSDEEAKTAKEEFNNVANQLNEIIPGIINNIYDENGAIALQRGEVESLTASYKKLMIAKSMANAYQAKMDQTSQDLVEIEEQLKLYEDGTKSKKKVNYLLGTVVDNKEYTDLVKQKKELEKEREGYFDSYQTHQKEVQELMDGDLKILKENTDKQNNIIETGNSARTASTKKEADKQSKILKEQQEKELRDLQFSHDIKEISDREYYEALERYRDKYFEEGSEEWQKYTQEIQDYYDSLVQEIKKKQEALANQLRGTEKKTYTKFTISAGGKTQTYTMLNSLEKSNQQLRNYEVLFDKLKSKYVNLPKEIMGYLAELNVEEGISYITALLNASESEFNRYIAGLQEEAMRSKAISEKIIPLDASSLMIDSTKEEYGQEIPRELFDIGKESAKKFSEGFSSQVKEDETEELRKALEKEFGEEVPEGFFDIGVDSARKFGEGFMNQLKGILQEVRAQILDSMSSLTPAVVMSAGGAGGGISNHYSNTYTFNSSRDTTTQQLFAAKNASQIEKMRGGD